MSDFFVIFESVPDPRDLNARHDLREMLFIALAAMLCGAECCVEMAEFGQRKEALLRTILELKHGVPSHDTAFGTTKHGRERNKQIGRAHV